MLFIRLGCSSSLSERVRAFCAKGVAEIEVKIRSARELRNDERIIARKNGWMCRALLQPFRKRKMISQDYISGNCHEMADQSEMAAVRLDSY